MKITKNTTINKMFELGFTEMRFKQLIVNENEDIFTLEDFKKMEECMDSAIIQ
jgi:hypothetical protein